MWIINLVLEKFLDIFSVVVAGIIGMYIEKKINSPKLLLIHSERGSKYSGFDSVEKNINVIDGYYIKQKNLNDKFVNYLKEIGADESLLYNNMLKDIVLVYRYTNDLPKLYHMVEIGKIAQLQKLLIDYSQNEEFIKQIKIYEAYMNNSKWIFNVINVGKQDIYNLHIESMDESVGRSITLGGTLKVNESRKIEAYYFDESLAINVFDVLGNNEFKSFCFKNAKQDFFLVKKIKYNKKYERVFKISYVDSRKKKKIYYACAKLKIINKSVKENVHNFFKINISKWINSD